MTPEHVLGIVQNLIYALQIAPLTDFVQVSYARLLLAGSSKCEVNHSIVNAKTCSIWPIILPIFRVVTLNELCVHPSKT